MAVDAIVRVSFQSSVNANQASNRALVGHPQEREGTGPFTRIGTAAYSCNNAREIDVARALAELTGTVLDHVATLDYLSVTIVRRNANDEAAAPMIVA